MIVVQYILFVSLLGPLVTSFAPTRMATSQRSCSLFAASDDEAKAPKDDSDFSDFTIEGKSDYSVDWDAEWKKVVANQGQPEERPGKGYYKSEAELAALRAANQAREKALQTAANIPSLPTWNAVKGDWKFWIGVLAAVSVATSLIANAGSSGNLLPPTGSSDSYYI